MVACDKQICVGQAVSSGCMWWIPCAYVQDRYHQDWAIVEQSRSSGNRLKCQTFRLRRSLSVTMHCNWRRPSRSKRLTFQSGTRCYVIAQQLPSPTYAVAMSLYQIIVTTLQECLFEAAIKTKFGRHYSECQPILESVRVALTGMKPRWTEER